MSEDVISTIWSRRVAWSRAADRLKAHISYARGAALVMIASGAILETAAATLLADVPRWRTVLAALGAVLLAVATFVLKSFVTRDAIRSWTRARSVSEAIKAEVFAYRAAAEPYQGAKPAALLLENVSDIERPAEDLERHVAGIEVGQDEVQPPPPLTPSQYIEQRILQQVDGYYRPKARAYASLLSGFRWAEFALGLIATVLGALAAYLSASQAEASPGIAAWVAVFTTLAAALAAHVAAGRYDFLVTSYHATARRLEDLLSKWRARNTPDDAKAWSDFVRACEDAISVENESWLAKYAEQEDSR